MKFALMSETSSASEIGKGIYNGKNKIGKTVSLRSTIIRENAKLDKQTIATKISTGLRYFPWSRNSYSEGIIVWKKPKIGKVDVLAIWYWFWYTHDHE